MIIQNQIKRTISTPSNIEYIRQLLENEDILHRTDLARRVCKQFEFYDARGETQIASCMKALRRLEQAGHITLPDVQRTYAKKMPRRLEEPVPLPVDVPDEVGDVQDLELVLVHTDDEKRRWNELMLREHPLGNGPFVGRQLRYLIISRHGCLGGFGFAAAALQLGDRDKWIGWDREQRQMHLHRVIGMSRFLIRPSVNCRNLASKVLSMSLARVAIDFEQRYQYKLFLVESFVDTAHYSGTCYRAANWIEIGKTQGRGRQDRFSECALSCKVIYVYPLESDFRKQLGLSPNAGLGKLEITDGLDTEHWAEHEFGGALLGDTRLSRRLVSVAAAKAEAPTRAFCGVAKGDWAATKAYYRMIDQPETSAVSMPNILAPHRERTVRRMMGQKVVLCLQDGSELNYTNLDSCTGLGELKANQTGAKTLGLNLHSTFAVAANGLPLGVLKAQCIAPQAKSADDERTSSQIPIEEKKTFVWIEHHRDLVELAGTMPQTKIVDVCDREADFFELFDEQRKNPGVDILIRAKHDRNIKEEPFKLFAAVRQSPIQGRIQVPLPKQSARTKKSKQKASKVRPKRMANLVLRHLQIQLPAPKGHADKAPVTVELIHAVEENPPADTKGVEWFLLTTIDINSALDIEKCLRWYTLRWRIEDWHRVLKSGCSIDKLAHETAERLRRAIAINLVIGWRIMLMTLLGRETPELPAEVLFSDIEIRTLHAYAKKKGLKPPTLLGDAVLLVAAIGGYLGRNNDPPPGHQLLWLGYTAFQYMSAGYSLMDDG
ncbi:MAG: IS4 family transposase [Gammaproteobacteria bacterium]|nr:MAG: IS4 family transposase [Gammaproteobacteria bacterium]